MKEVTRNKPTNAEIVKDVNGQLLKKGMLGVISAIGARRGDPSMLLVKLVGLLASVLDDSGADNFAADFSDELKECHSAFDIQGSEDGETVLAGLSRIEEAV